MEIIMAIDEFFTDDTVKPEEKTTTGIEDFFTPDEELPKQPQQVSPQKVPDIVTPPPEPPVIRSPEIEEDEANTINNLLTTNDINVPQQGTLAKELAKAESDRRELLVLLNTIENYEQEARSQGLSPEETQKQVDKMVAAKYGNTTIDDIFSRLFSGGQREATSPRLFEKGLKGEKEYVSFTKGLESVFGNIFSPSKWTALDKEPREQIRAILSQPIIDENGNINEQAADYSSLPREWQNQLTAANASKQTGIPTEIWNEIIQARLGQLPGQSAIGGFLRTTGQVADSIAYNLGTKAPLEAKLSVLKGIEPMFPIRVTKDENGDTIYDMPGTMVDGMEVDVEADPSTAKGQQKLWANFISDIGSHVSDSALSSSADIVGMGVEAGISALLAATGVGAPAAALGAARVAGKVKRAARLGKAAQVSEVVAKGYRLLQGEMPLLQTVSKLTPAGKQAFYQVVRKQPVLAGVLQASDRIATVAATHMALTYAGSSEKSGFDQALVAGMISVPLNMAPAIREGWAASTLAKYPKAYKEIAKAGSEAELSSFSKKIIAESGLSFNDVKKDVGLFQKNTEMVLDAVAKIEAGLIPDRVVPELQDAVAKSPEFRTMVNRLSETSSGLSVEGRYNQELIRDLFTDLQSKARELKQTADGKIAPSLAAVTPEQVRVSVVGRGIKEAKAIPAAVMNDTAKLDAYLKANKTLSGFRDEIMNALQNQGGVEATYLRLAGQMIQAGVIAKGMKGGAGTTMRVFTQMLAEPGEDLRRFEALYRRGEEVRGVRTPTGDIVELPRISPTKTVENLLKFGPDTIRSVLKETRDVLDEYTGIAKIARGAGAPEMARGIKARKQLLKQKEAEFMRQTTMMKSELTSDMRQQSEQGVRLIKRKIQLQGKLKHLSAQQVGDIMSAIKQKDAKRLSAFDPADVKNVNALRRNDKRMIEVQERMVADQARLDEIDNFRATGSIDSLNRVYQFADVDSDLGIEFRKTFNIKELENNSFWRRLTEKIAYEWKTSLEDTGIPIISNESLQAMRLLQDDKFVKEFVPGLKQEQRRFIGKQAKVIARGLHRENGMARILKDKIKILQERIVATGDSPSQRTMAVQLLNSLRETYGGIYAIRRDLNKLDQKLGGVIEKMDAGKSLDPEDMKTLYSFSKSKMMTMYRAKYNPNWVVSMAEEAQAVITLIENTGARSMELFTDALKRYLPDADEVDVALAAGRFFNATNHFDSTGWMSVALMSSNFWKEDALIPKGNFDFIKLRELLYFQDNMTAYLSRETGMGVDTAMARYTSAVNSARQETYKINKQFMDDLDNIPGYKDHNYGHRLTRVLKRFAGFRGFEEWPMAEGKLTEFGKLLYQNKVDGKNIDDLLKPLYDDAEKLSRVTSAGTGMYRNKYSEYSLRMDQLNTYRRGLESYWNIEGGEPELWKMSFDIQRHIQLADMKRLRTVNESIRRLNKLWGTKFEEYHYNPYRLDSYVKKDLDALQSTGAISRDGALERLMGDSLMGRTLSTDKPGQIRKISGLSEVDVENPIETFLMSSELLMRNIHTRDAMTQLRDLGLRMADGGYERFADAMARMITRSYAEVSPSAPTRKVIAEVANFLRVPRVIASYFNPFTALATIYKTGIENPLQTFIMASSSSVKHIPTLPKDAMIFMGKWLPRIFKPDANADAMIRELTTMCSSLPPEAQIAIRQHVAAARKLEQDRFTRQKNIVRWNASSRWKAAYRGGNKVDWLNEGLFGRLKDNSETALKEIYGKYAAVQYVSAIEAVQKAPNRNAAITAARDILKKRVSGVLQGADVSEMAINLVDNVQRGAPYRGLSGYLFQVDAAMIGRFDTNNIPMILVALDRWLPGVASFANPIYLGASRMMKFVTNGWHRKGNLTAENAAMATMGALAFLGIHAMIKGMENDDNDFGIGTSKYLQRLDPLIQVTDVVSGLKGAWESPAVRVGSMGERAAIRGFSALFDVISAMPDAMRAWSSEKAAQVDSDLEAALFTLGKEIEGITPLVFLRDFLGSPLGWGLTYLGTDGGYVRNMIEREMQRDPLVGDNVEFMKYREKMNPAQEFLLGLSEMLCIDNPLMTDERYANAQNNVRLSLGKLGIGRDNALLWELVSNKRLDTMKRMGLYEEMKSKGALAWPGEFVTPPTDKPK